MPLKLYVGEKKFTLAATFIRIFLLTLTTINNISTAKINN